MTDLNIALSRHLLAMAHEQIRKTFPGVNLQKSISQVGPHGKQYFVQINVPSYPDFDDYYQADNAYEAKYKAWMAFFEKYAPDQIKREIEAAL